MVGNGERNGLGEELTNIEDIFKNPTETYHFISYLKNIIKKKMEVSHMDK